MTAALVPASSSAPPHFVFEFGNSLAESEMFLQPVEHVRASVIGVLANRPELIQDVIELIAELFAHPRLLGLHARYAGFEPRVIGFKPRYAGCKLRVIAFKPRHTGREPCIIGFKASQCGQYRILAHDGSFLE
jgi:hypothetical protein